MLVKHIQRIDGSIALPIYARGFSDIMESPFRPPSSTFYPNIEAVIAIEDEKVVGIISYFLDKETETSYWINLSYVLPSHRQKGVWKKMYKKLVEVAKSRHIKVIEGGIHVDNTAMIESAKSVGRRAKFVTYTHDLTK